MNRLRSSTVVVALCAALIASSAWAEGSPFVGRWHWNRAQSTLPPDEPAPDDLISDISRADGGYVTWSITIVAPDGRSHVVMFGAPANGEPHRISSDTSASARLAGDALQATFYGPGGYGPFDYGYDGYAYGWRHGRDHGHFDHGGWGHGFAHGHGGFAGHGGVAHGGFAGHGGVGGHGGGGGGHR